MTLLTCTRCEHKWIPNLNSNPKHCAKCNSPNWNKPRKYIKRPKKEDVKIAAKVKIGPGWHVMIDNLIEDLYKMRWDGNLINVGHRHNGLWFHIGKGGSMKMHDRIRIAETKSFLKCEKCGKPTARAHAMPEAKCKCL